VLGLASTGVHSNGFSLLRQVVAASGIGWHDPAPFGNGETLARAMLRPTRIYVGSVLALHRAGLLKAAAHITGGGLRGNLPRVLPHGTVAALLPRWTVPPVFGWLARTGGVAATEMLRVFNCGVGMALVVAEADVGAATALLERAGETVFHLGSIAAADGAASVRIDLPMSWPP
jgi:phosphoribosylformylglycinamidine cyclo-ligase